MTTGAGTAATLSSWVPIDAETLRQYEQRQFANFNYSSGAAGVTGYIGGTSQQTGVPAGFAATASPDLLGRTALTPIGSQSQTAMPRLGAGNQVVYAHYAAPAQAATGAATTAGGAPAATAAPAPAVAKPVATKPAKTKAAEPKNETVKVKSGDSLSKIAAAHGTTWQKLYALNKGVIGGDPNLIRPGQELKLP